MKEKFLKQAEHEYSPASRILALLVEGLLFLVILPLALIYLAPLLDRQLGLPSLAFGAINVILGCAVSVAGILLAWLTIYVQFTIGRGTPVPMMATQQLIVQRPYNYCRNPMALGAILLYLGVAILLGSIGAVVLVLIGAVLLMTYIKLVEEKEMVLRFGESYQAYRKQTPFIIPRFW